MYHNTFTFCVLHLHVCSSCTVIAPPSPITTSLAVPNLESIVLPYVLIWNPLEQFHLFFTNGMQCPKADCVAKVHLCRWNIGHSEGHCPRLIHDINYLLILVPEVYECDNKHEIVSTDPFILQQFPEEEYIPFILFHRIGITRDFTQTTIGLALQGLAFTAIERFIQRRRQENVASLQLAYLLIYTVN